MLNLNTFLKSFPGGFQRPNRFLCKLDVRAIFQVGRAADPSGVGDVATQHAAAIRLLQEGLICTTVSMPDRRFQTTELNIYGYEEKYPTGLQYGDLECMFMAPLVNHVDVVHRFFSAWHSFIQNHRVSGQGRGDLVLRFPDEYRVPQGMTIELIDTSREGLLLDRPRNVFRFARSAPENPELPFVDEATKTVGDYWITNKIRIYNVYPMSVNSSQLDWGVQDEMMSMPITFSYTSWETVPRNS